MPCEVVMDGAVVGSCAYTAGGDAKDLADTEMRRQVWAGAVPMNLAYGELIPTPGNLVKEVPWDIEKWRENENENECEVFQRGLNVPKK
jgi:hypothetical protein